MDFICRFWDFNLVYGVILCDKFDVIWLGVEREFGDVYGVVSFEYVKG